MQIPDNKINIVKRIKSLRVHFGLNSGEFASKAGIDPRNYSSIETGKRTIGERVLRDICNAFDVNIDWILTGEGDMLKGGSSIRHENGSSPQINYENKGVPYYDVDFIAGFDLVQNDQTQTPSCYIDFPQYNNSTYWVNITGKSMEPLISQGDMIAIKELPDWQTYILYGEIYAIVTDEYRTIKKIRKGSDGNNILLVPLNPEYDSQEIPKSIIRSVFQVNGCVKRII